MVGSIGWKFADPKVEPLADAPTPADWEWRGTAIKEMEEAVERLGRVLRVIRSWLGLAICEDPIGGDGKTNS